MGALYNLISAQSLAPVKQFVAVTTTTETTTPSTLRGVAADICTTIMITNASDSPLYIKFFASSTVGLLPSIAEYDVIVPRQSVLSIPGTSDGMFVSSGSNGPGAITATAWYASP